MDIVRADSYIRKSKKLITARDEAAFISDLSISPELGDVIKGGHGIRKARFGIPSQRIGKRGGLRVIYYYYVDKALIFLDVYSKSQQDNLSDAQVQRLYTMLKAELESYQDG